MSQLSDAPVPPGTRIGIYEIVGQLGAGGMGQVYRARDTRLDRDVALKVLPEAFSSDADRLMRFTREAKTLASLNHPHIAQIYDTGRLRPEGASASQGVRPDVATASQGREVAYIAMELVQGEDLSARIRRGAVPLNEALQIARQIADALAAAHEAGIVHRDLKPANVKIADDDVVKVLDFGLAKGGATDLSSAVDSGATMTSPAKTAIGVILGTAAYMSPEQAKGKPVDRRADVWAFGVVLYEMLTGAFLFGKEDVTDTLAAVLTHEPDLAKLPATTPPAIKRLLSHCLAKDKRQRLDSMAAARIEIDDVLAGKADIAGIVAAKPGTVSWVLALALAAGGVLVGALAVSFWPRAPVASSASSLVARITAPRETISAFHDGFAISHDGSTLAFAGRNATGTRQIWIRRLDSDAARAIPGTEGGRYPSWSPDGRSIAFHADAKLRRVDADGSRLQAICDWPGDDGVASWNQRDEILFDASIGRESRVYKVSASGGAATAVDALGNAYSPIWLSDGQKFLYAVVAGPGKVELRLASSDGQLGQTIAPLSRRTAEFAYGGGVLFLNKNETLVAQRLDPSSGTLTGAAVPIAPAAGNPGDWFAVSSNGDRVVALVRESPSDSGDPGDPNARLIWVDRQGNTTGTLGDSGRYWTLRLHPDGRSAIVNPGDDLWLLKPDGRHMRVTSGTQSLSPVWNRDGSEIVYAKGSSLVRRRIEPQSPESVLATPRFTLGDWSSDGRWLLMYGRSSPSSISTDILVYDFEKQTARPWLATEFAERHARFSSDGHWVAYTSNSSGRPEVYVRAFEGNGEPIVVSAAGGDHPIWRRDGTELYFLSPGDDVMAVTLTRSGTSLTPGQPQRLFRIPLNAITRVSWAPYAVAPDGDRFLLNVPDRPTPLFFLEGLRGMVR